MATNSSTQTIYTVLAAASIFLLGIVLLWVLLTLPAPSSDLLYRVVENIEQSGVQNPVTAVLLNFRAFDTLLEIAVLFLALLAVWTVPFDDISLSIQPTNHFLTTVLYRIVPFIVITAGYYLWIGTKQPGGAFQAGAILSSALILLVLTEINWKIRYGSLKILIVAGLTIFLAIGLYTIIWNNAFLHYRLYWATYLILTIETACAISIATILTSLFTANPNTLSEFSSSRGVRL